MQRMTVAQRAPFTLALATFQAKAIKAEPKTGLFGMSTHRRLGGSTVRYVRESILFPYAQGVCVCCGQDTMLNVNPANANAATMGILLPCALMNDEESDIKRAGILPGNCANFCRACVNASNGGNNGAPLWIWAADCIDADLVPMVWGPLRKAIGPVMYVPNEVDLIRYARRSAIVRARRGLIN